MTVSWSHCARYLLSFSLIALISGCCSISPHDPMNVAVVGIEAAPGQPMESRFTVTLSLQNPNSEAIKYEGIAVEMDINARPLATGVSNQKGEIPRYGESLLRVPMTISDHTLKHQSIGESLLKSGESVSYDLRGKLGNCAGGEKIETRGSLKWPQPTY